MIPISTPVTRLRVWTEWMLRLNRAASAADSGIRLLAAASLANPRTGSDALLLLADAIDELLEVLGDTAEAPRRGALAEIASQLRVEAPMRAARTSECAR